MTTIYLLVISIIVPISTYLLKRFSLRTLFLAANAFFLVGLVTFIADVCHFADWPLFQGASTGIALPLMFHIILTYLLWKRGAAIGLGNLTTSIAPAIGHIWGLIDRPLVLNAIFLFLIPVLLISLVLGLYSIPKNGWTKDTSLDLLSRLDVQRLLIVLESSRHLSESTAAAFRFHWCWLVLSTLKRPEPLIRFLCLKPQLPVCFCLSCLSVPFTAFPLSCRTLSNSSWEKMPLLQD